MAGEMYRCTQHQTLKLRVTEKLGVSNQCIVKAFKGSLRAFGFWMLLSRGMESKNEKKNGVNAVIELTQTDGYWTRLLPYNSHLKLCHWVRFSLHCRTSCFLHQSQEKLLKHLPVGQNEVVGEGKVSFRASSTAPNTRRRVAVVKSSYWQLRELPTQECMLLFCSLLWILSVSFITT